MNRVVPVALVACALVGCGGGRGGDRPASSDPALQAFKAYIDRAAAIPSGPDPQEQPASTTSRSQAVATYRRLGFFASARDRRRALRHASRPLTSRLDELELVAQDHHRVWWEDTEADVAAGNGAYVPALRAWARISRGAFAPRAIHERWRSENGPVDITFTLGGRRHVLRGGELDDFLDLRVLLVGVDHLIARTGIQFALYEPFDQTAFIVAVTRRERRRLERLVGWRFATRRQALVPYQLG